MPVRCLLALFLLRGKCLSVSCYYKIPLTAWGKGTLASLSSGGWEVQELGGGRFDVW